MKLPNQTIPIVRGYRGMVNNKSQIEPSGLACTICDGAIKGVGSVAIGLGCTAAVSAFEVACNAALDWIPIIGEGPSEVACAAGGAALEVACKAGGGTVTSGTIAAAQKAVCGHFC